MDQIACQSRYAIILTLRPTMFDSDILTFDVTALSKTPVKAVQTMPESAARFTVEKTHYGCFLRLLAARRQRPRGYRATEERDEFAALHSITSSARCCRCQGTSRPSDF